jgi:hypothetical protein
MIAIPKLLQNVFPREPQLLESGAAKTRAAGLGRASRVAASSWKEFCLTARLRLNMYDDLVKHILYFLLTKRLRRDNS